MSKIMAAVISFVIVAVSVCAEIVQREGNGFLEEIQTDSGITTTVLHLKGSPYEMGVQHGKLLKNLIEQNVTAFIDTPNRALAERVALFQKALPDLMHYVPARFQKEMEGIADGSGIALSKIIALNTFPELSQLVTSPMRPLLYLNFCRNNEDLCVSVYLQSARII